MDTITDIEERKSQGGGLPRSIQSSGFLIALTDEWLVECASANVGAFLGLEPDELIGSAASTFLTDDAIHDLRNRLALLREPDGIERLFACQLKEGALFDVAIQVAGDQVIVEAEPSSGKLYGDVTGTLHGMKARVDEAENLPDLYVAGARQVRALVGFDRVLLRRLDGNGSGTVLAEAARGSVDPVTGGQASVAALAPHELDAFLRTPLHVVGDVESELVNIVGRSSGAERCVDLTRAVLRSASHDQLDQLRMSGVRASLTIALVVNGALWGIFSCHHNTPRRISFERRAMVELFAQLFAMQIEIAELKATLSLSGTAPA